MNPNPSRTLWLSVGMGVFAMFLIYSYSQEKKAEYDDKYGRTKRIVVATQDILEMQTIDETMVEYREVPFDYVQPGAYEDIEETVTRVAAVPFKQGEQLLNTKTLALGPNTGLSNQVAPNKRAVSIPIDEVRGVSKLLQPGDRIDILATVEVGRGPNKTTQVKTIMQDVVVLATGERITNNIPRKLVKDSFTDEAMFKNLKGDLSFSAITIEASPQEAQNIVYLMSASPGGIYITLRNRNDRLVNRMGPSTANSIAGGVSPNFKKAIRQPRTPAAAPKRKPKRKRRNRGPFQDVN